MRLILIVVGLMMAGFTQKQVPMPHGMVYGRKPDTSSQINVNRLEAYMGKKTRIAISVKGTISAITRARGGWFTMNAGRGRVVSAHFSDYNVTLPLQLKGRQVIVQGVAQKQFIADDLQHFAGDTVKGKKQHTTKVNAMRKITFEVIGLMVN